MEKVGGGEGGEEREGRGGERVSGRGERRGGGGGGEIGKRAGGGGGTKERRGYPSPHATRQRDDQSSAHIQASLVPSLPRSLGGGLGTRLHTGIQLQDGLIQLLIELARVNVEGSTCGSVESECKIECMQAPLHSHPQHLVQRGSRRQ